MDKPELGSYWQPLTLEMLQKFVRGPLRIIQLPLIIVEDERCPVTEEPKEEA